MNEKIQDLLSNVEQLISLPAAYVRLNELVEDPTSSADDIAHVITQDVALTARLLRVANSPLYGLSTQIDTVSRAVTVLGTQQVRDLALATSACKSFDGIPNELVSMESFWEHSILCALCARTLALECFKRQREASSLACYTILVSWCCTAPCRIFRAKPLRPVSMARMNWNPRKPNGRSSVSTTQRWVVSWRAAGHCPSACKNVSPVITIRHRPNKTAWKLPSCISPTVLPPWSN
ncbi:MAG: HDOD domain-containing protein [Gammaproteobacteria bacterium]|nr:HDOD domain-containing protein [Gammaproteobacteria bacterium]